LKAQEYGMKVYEVVEYNTSKYCAYHNVEVKRYPRGVVSCPKGHKLHSDLNGALNNLKRAIGTVVSTVEKSCLSWGSPRPSGRGGGQLATA
jgi:putative transposase